LLLDFLLLLHRYLSSSSNPERTNERPLPSFQPSKQALVLLCASANLRRPRDFTYKMKEQRYFRIQEKRFVKNVHILKGQQNQNRTALIQSWPQSQAWNYRRDISRDQDGPGFLVDAVSLTRQAQFVTVQRLHHRRPVERRNVVDVVRPAIPLEVRLDRLLVELAILLLRRTTRRRVVDIIASHRMTRAQHSL
jgi:hypothetical protein